MSDVGKRKRSGYMYTPFGGADALKSALGENMARMANHKAAMGLIAPTHKVADKLETLRQTTLTSWGNTIAQSRQVLGGIGQRRRLADADFLASIRASVDDPHATAQSTRDARRDARGDHQFAQDMIGGDKVLHDARLSSMVPRHDALAATRILNTTPQDESALNPKPLSFLRPDSEESGGDKLYVLGHGAPGDKNIYARSDGTGGHLSAPDLATHLSEAGLPKSAMDVRLTACQGVPAIQEETDTPAKDTKESGYLVPEVAKAFHGLGFQDLSVTGYQGNGVTYPFNSTSHLRSDPDDDTARVKRSLAAIRYPVKEMGE